MFHRRISRTLPQQPPPLLAPPAANDGSLFRALTEQSMEFVSILDADGRFRYVSPSVRKTLGYTPEALVGTYPVDLVHEDDLATMIATHSSIGRGGPGAVADMLVRLRHINGSWRYFEGGGQNLLHDPAVRGIASTARDVTQRIEAARTAHAADVRFRNFVESSPEGVWAIDAAGITTYVNPRVLTLLGYAAERLQHRAIFDFMPATSATAARAMFAQGMSATPIELEFVRRDGTLVHALVTVSHIPGERNGLPGILVMITDITERKRNDDRTREAVREREGLVASLETERTRLREQFAKMPVPTFLWEARGDTFVLVEFNDAAAPLVSGGRAAIGRTALDTFNDLSWDFSADCASCLRDGVVIRRTIVAAATAATEQQTFVLTIGPQHPDRVLIHAVDITEQTRLANELRQAQKMEAVGQLAGGVAHDFNNLLTVIGAHSAFLLQGLAAGDVRREDALAIQQAGDRAAALTRQLLAFSRKQLLMPAVTNLNLVVEDTHRMLGRVLGDDIDCVLDLSPVLGCVLVDVGQVEQVLMNLVLNARDAMPSGGRVSITTREIDVAPGSRLAQSVALPGRYAVLSIVDAGAGMDAETRARAFEPFFTTKDVDKGTGLGLSTVYGIVKQLDGFIHLESALGAGTRFDVYFPIVVAMEPIKSPEVSERRTSRGVETVLLVEDDAAVRQIATRVLVREGYQVLEASDGRAALQLSASHHGPIDAVITDAVMPGMTGVAVLASVLADHPDCKAILMSGYTDDEMTRRGISSADVSFLQKPFTPFEFARQVRHALDA
jgi:PAS domain S-box-containing protein